ncbi:MAG: hypothetical protein RH942_09265 [Kiloniellaceae bacterium]
MIEPWRETSSFTYERGERLFRWTVTYEANPKTEDAPASKEIRGERVSVRFGQGTARTHAEARQAAEAFLAERGIELSWQPPASSTTRILTPRSGKPRFLHL